MSDEPKFIDGMRLTAEPKADRLVDGLMLKKPHDKSPDFVKAKGSINLESFGKWLVEYKKQKADNEWVNLMIQEPYFQAKMSLKLDDFEGWIADFVKNNPSKEWINFDIKESKSGNLYAEVDTWERDKQDEKPKEEPKSDSMPEWMKG